MPGSKDGHEKEDGTSEPMVGQIASRDDTFKRRMMLAIVAVFILVLIIVLLIVLLLTSTTPVQGEYTVQGLRAILGSKILFDPSDPSSYEEYVKRLNETLEPYQNVQVGGQIVRCNETTKLEEKEVCIFEADWLSSCSKNNFGFSNSQPCVLLTYGNDTSFDPEVYESFADIPSDIPRDLNLSIYISYESNNREILELVWVHCTEVYSYFPFSGFNKYYFPNKDLDAYLPPVVGLIFVLDDKEEKNVECSLWSKTNDRMQQRTSVSFTIHKTS